MSKKDKEEVKQDEGLTANALQSEVDRQVQREVLARNVRRCADQLEQAIKEAQADGLSVSVTGWMELHRYTLGMDFPTKAFEVTISHSTKKNW